MDIPNCSYCNVQMIEKYASLFVCPYCKHGITVYSTPPIYREDYYDLDIAEKVERDFRKYHQKDLQKVLSYNKGKSFLLDIGCSVGMFVKTAEDGGLSAVGVDIGKVAIEFGKKMWSIDLFCSLIQDYRSPRLFNIVTIWNTLEHFKRPKEVLRVAYKFLYSDGIIAIRVPNFGSIERKIFGKRWGSLSIPYHYQHFTRKSLVDMLVSEKFKILHIDYYTFQHNWVGLLGSVMEMSPPMESFIHKVIRKLIGTPLAKIISRFTRGTICIIAKKVE